MRKTAFKIHSVFIISCLIQLMGFPSETKAIDQEKSMELSSPAFKNNGSIPPLYTAEGQDISVPLVWKNTPSNTVSFALICEDPDAPGGTWIHWILYNIPPSLNSIDDGGSTLTPEVLFGANSWGKLAYGGPNPPRGVHHYHFTLYALDTLLPLKAGATKDQLMKAMEGHILAQATLIGLYQRLNADL